jgi:hypothetical protein
LRERARRLAVFQNGMETIESRRTSFEQLVQIRVFRHARWYAPAAVTAELDHIVGAPEVALVVDLDALERSPLARIDRVMLLALDALGHAGLHVVLAAKRAVDRAVALQPRVRGATVLDRNDGSIVVRLRVQRPDVRVIALTDDPELIAELGELDRGIALGRPELAGEHVVAAGDTAVRATLWWLLFERLRAEAA